MTDPIRAALERLVARLDETTDPNGPVPAWSDSFYAARAALSADGPAVPEGREPASVVTEPSDAELESFLLDVAAEHGDIYWAEPLVLARAVLARWGHQPAPPAEGEVGEVTAWLRAYRDEEFGPLSDHPDVNWLTRAADLLEQRHPAPVPVSERLPGPDDCLDEGWVWFFSSRVGWRQSAPPVSPAYTHWLPAHALPLPAGEVQP